MSSEEQAVMMGEQTSMAFRSASRIFVCVKWVATRIEVDPVDGSVTHRPHDGWFSAADLAAVETALRLADGPVVDAGGPDGGGDDGVVGPRAEVLAICVGPPEADDSLRDLIAVGVDRVIRVDSGHLPDPSDQPASSRVAQAMADVITEETTGPSADRPADVLVICGDLSADRGSGSVPAFMADRLGASQALGLLEVSRRIGADEAGGTSPAVVATARPSVNRDQPATLRCVRRLDGGRRELLRVTTPAVISVEGSVARLRRAPLASMVGSRDAPIDLRRAEIPGDGERPVLRPYRPRTRVVAPPVGDDALERIEHLTGLRTDRTPPRTLVAEPREAAGIILDQLREWGYEWRTD